MQPETARVVARSLLIAAVPVGLAGVVVVKHVLGLALAMGAPYEAQLPTPQPAAVALPVVPTSTDGPVDLSLRLDRGAVVQGGDGLVHVEVKLKGDVLAGDVARSPTDLVVVLDRSGSMSGEKFMFAKEAVAALVGQLQDEDQFALVAFDSDAELEIGLTQASAANRTRWTGLARELEIAGGTNISAGLDLGMGQLDRAAPGRVRRVVLISDGQPTDGDTSNTGLIGRARSSAIAETPVTAVGVGMDFNEDLMRGISDAGTGNYYFVETGDNLARVFGNELLTAASTVASALEVHVDPGAGVSLISAAGYPVEHSATDAFFRVGAMYSGQERSIWLTLRVDPSATGPIDLGDIHVRYRADDLIQSASIDHPLAVLVVADPDQALASIDRVAWEERVVTDEYNSTQLAVAAAVKSGNKAEADKAIIEYRTRNAAMNERVGSARVARQLQELSDVQNQVNDSFSGEGQQQKQNVYSKKASKDATDKLRSLGYLN